MESRDIDRKIAKLMGWRYREYYLDGKSTMGWFQSNGNFADLDRVPSYTTDIAAAWMVVEKMSGGRSDNFSIHRTGGRYGCRFRDIESADKPEFSEADTAPMAICLAALRALGDGGGG